MSKFTILFTLAAAAISCAAAPQRMQLEWNSTYPANTAYEVELDRAKLEKLAGIPKNDSYTVIATVNGKEQKLDSEVYPGSKADAIALRFTVPAGTTALACENNGKKIVLKDAAAEKNIFSGALDAKNIKNWKLSGNISATPISGGIRLDAGILNKNVTASFTADVPPESAGRPVKLELDVRSVSKMAWPNRVKIEQYDAAGKLLPEYVTDHRWISQMRPSNILTQYREPGFIRPDAKKIKIIFTLYAANPGYDSHGLLLKNKNDVTPHLEISRLVLRSAETLPFPKLNDVFFAPGVSGKPHDTAVAMKDGLALFFSTRSSAMWSQSTEVRNPKEIYFPVGNGTVEAFVKPAWKNTNRNSVLFEAKSFLIRTKSKYAHAKGLNKGRGALFCVSYIPKQKKVNILVQGADLVDHKVTGKADIPSGKWSHIAVQWSEEKGIEFYLNGKLAFSKKCPFKSMDLSKEAFPNDSHATQFTIGMETVYARGKTFTPTRTNAYEGLLDGLRISSVARYSGTFTPQKTPSADADTNALFNFDRSFDGVTLFGTGRISNAVRAKYAKIDRKLSVGNRSVDYYPANIAPHSDPRVVLNPLNYPVLPTVKEFKQSYKTEQLTFSAKPGDTRNVKLDGNVVMDYIEYANDSKTVLRHPFLIKKGEIDPRSFGDLADSLGIQGLSPKEKVNRIFQFLLASSDYFGNHQATFPVGSDLPENVEYKALMMLNGYCGFECGPLNNLSANLFTTSGLCPASQTGGYGHSFESVFYDGKSHVYDLSAQKFFTASDNESAASLSELELEPGLMPRLISHNNPVFSTSPDHFVRLGNRRHSVQMPSYQAKVSMSLNPGEKLRVYYSNDGMVNDLQCAHHIDLGSLEQAVDYEKETGAKVTRANRRIFRIDRFFPHYANAFLVFNGKPALNNPAFKSAKDGFCYNVSSCYPIVFGTYSARLSDGSFADIEISTDLGKTFRKLKKDPDGVVREDYKVRARMGYLIKVKAPISKVANFTGVTEMQVNPRVLTSKLAKGNNELLFKATSGKGAKITIQFRKPDKDIVIDGAFYNGVIPGHERQTALLDPVKGLSLKVTGASDKATVKSSSGVSAKLKNGKLTVSALKGTLPRFDFVEINDNGAKKELTLIVAENAQLVSADKACDLKKAKLLKADGKLIQDVVRISEEGSMKLKIAPIKKGKYSVWLLTRFNSHLRPASGPRAITLKAKEGWTSVAGAVNCGSDFYKAQHGKPGERAQFKWDYPLKYRYPYEMPTSVTLKETDKLRFKISGKNVGESEIAAVLIMPEQSGEFLNQMIKILCGYNHEPWKISQSNLSLFK